MLTKRRTPCPQRCNKYIRQRRQILQAKGSIQKLRKIDGHVSKSAYLPKWKPQLKTVSLDIQRGKGSETSYLIPAFMLKTHKSLWKNPEHSFFLDHNFMRDRCKSTCYWKQTIYFFLKKWSKPSPFYLMVKNLIWEIKNVNLESFRLKMALTIKSLR